MFLGVDGGGTKTEFCLIDAQGAVVGSFRAAGCSYLAIGFDGLARILGEGVDAVCRAGDTTPDAVRYAFFGLPSYGESSRDVARLDAIPASLFPDRRYRCDNDAVCGWAGSLGAADGVNVVAGTGSMTYGEYRGRKARCGGWGEVFGDEGSAYWIAVRGLSCFSRMSDGRLPKGALHERLRATCGLARDLDVVDLVFNQWHGDRARIAALSKVVVESAQDGDAHALEILRLAADELAALVVATRAQLEVAADAELVVSYSGGMFRSGPRFVADFRRALDAQPGRYALREPLFPPARGAALYAAKLCGAPIDAGSPPSRD